MTIRRPGPFTFDDSAQRKTCRFFVFLVVLACLAVGAPSPSIAQQACQPDGDVDRSGSVAAADALLTFQQVLGRVVLDACQQTIANVFPSPAMPDAVINAEDALCIFRKALDLPSCLDVMAPSNQPPSADAGGDQFVSENEPVTLSGSGADADGTIVEYGWEQSGGATVALSGADTPNAMFTAPEVPADETLTFRLTVTDNSGATGSDDVRVTVRAQAGVDVAAHLAGPVARGEVPGLIAAVIDAQGGFTAAGAAGVRRQGSPRSDHRG